MMPYSISNLELPLSLKLCHTPILDPTRMADPNQVQDARLYTGTLYLFFFFLKAELVPVGIQTIYVITKKSFTYTKKLSPEWCPSKSIHIYWVSFTYTKTVLLHLQIRAWNLHVVNLY